MSSRHSLRIEVNDRIATLTIDRPEARNALDRRTVDAFSDALRELGSAPDVGALIITGQGERVFASGADLREMRHWGRDDGLASVTSSLFRVVETFSKPTIAAVNGAALGGGCELALACDLRVASSHATFGQPEVKLGVIPAAGGTQRLPRIIGLGRAKHMIMTGDPIDSTTALAWGLVSAVTPAGELAATAKTLAERVLACGPLALRLARLLLNTSPDVDLAGGLLLETLAQAICFQSDEKAEGTAAFLEKRPPRFGV